MTDSKKPIISPDLQKVEPALRRAAKKAREENLRANAPFIVFRDGKIVDLNSPKQSSIPQGE